MHFQVPQFIEIEDKIFGPLTFRQFIFIVGGFGLSFLLYRFLPKLIAFPLIAGALGFSFALAFHKVNERPFINALESAFLYLFSEKRYIWRHTEKKKEEKETKSGAPLIPSIPRMSKSKLKDIAWSLDIRENVEK